MSKIYSGNQVAKNLCSKFPNTASLALAKKAFKENPLIFSSVDNARCAIRQVRGAIGAKNRRNGQENTTPLTVPTSLASDFIPFKIQGNFKVALAGDFHFPYHDKKPIEIWINDAKRFGANVIILNGDLMDMHTLSRFDKEPNAARFKREREITIEFLRFLRSKFPKARIILKEGNHDERLGKYVMSKAPEIWDEEIFGLDHLLNLDDLGIELVSEKREIKLGKLNILHGHEMPNGIAMPVNPARGLFLRAKETSMCNHFHKTSEHTETTLSRHIVTCWSVGCMCALRPQYMPNNGWNHGFARIETKSNGDFSAANLRIHDGKLL